MLQTSKKRWKYVKAEREARREFQLLIALSPLIRVNISKASTNVMLCSEASLTSEATLNCPFEPLQESQRRIVSNAYYALNHDVNVPDFTLKLIST